MGNIRGDQRRMIGIVGVVGFALAACVVWLSARMADGTERKTAMVDAELLSRIRQEASNLYIPPIDARADRVWKAIPGYNGLEVDVEKTFEEAKRRGIEAGIPWVFREVPPKVGLDDLGPLPIYKGNPRKPMAALMVNVAWGDEHLPAMLETFRESGVRATFFFDGSWLSRHLETARRIGEDGHELSNHAYSHPNMSRLSRERQREEIVKTQTILKERLGVDNRLFAPPSGDYDDTTVRVAYELGLKTILWTIDTVDWKNPPPDAVVRKVKARLEPGSLILMHPTPASRAALADMIRVVRAEGLALGTVSELISPARIRPDRPLAGPSVIKYETGGKED